MLQCQCSGLPAGEGKRALVHPGTYVGVVVPVTVWQKASGDDDILKSLFRATAGFCLPHNVAIN